MGKRLIQIFPAYLEIVNQQIRAKIRRDFLSARQATPCAYAS
jgi:hypothetical protein